MLTGEPWLWLPKDIAELTDYQAWELVIRPAIKRNQKLKDETGGAKTGHGWERSKRKLPNKRQYIMVGEKLGVPAEVSEREWAKFLARRRGKNNGRDT